MFARLIDSLDTILEIQNDSLCLWEINYRHFKPYQHDLFALLSSDEQGRASAYRQPDKTLAYTLAHAFLRLALAKYTGLAPEKLEISHGKFTKPSLYGSMVDFSLSYTYGTVAIGLVNKANIGVDIETLHAHADLPAIARAYFREDERYRFDADQTPLGFYQVWTRKESYLKALGKGLSEPIDHFSVLDLPGWYWHEFQSQTETIGVLAVNQPLQKIIHTQIL